MTFEEFAAEPYCYLTTTGRTSGEPREIEIWFGTEGLCLYLMAGGRDKAHWVRNLRKHPEASVRIAERHFRVRCREVSEPGEDALARRLLLEKYSPGYSGDLASWGRSALPVALDPIEER
jgi:deazaflavin-dependent oxidoreductase (nitroreductase family)